MTLPLRKNARLHPALPGARPPSLVQLCLSLRPPTHSLLVHRNITFRKMQGEGPGPLGIFKIAWDTQKHHAKMAQEALGLGPLHFSPRNFAPPSFPKILRGPQDTLQAKIPDRVSPSSPKFTALKSKLWGSDGPKIMGPGQSSLHPVIP